MKKSPAQVVSTKKTKKATPKQLPMKPSPVRDQLIDFVRHIHSAGHGLLAGARVLIERAEGCWVCGDCGEARSQLDLAQKYLETFRGLDVDFVDLVDLGEFPFEPLRTAESDDWDERASELDSWGIDDGPSERAAEILDARCKALANALTASQDSQVAP